MGVGAAAGSEDTGKHGWIGRQELGDGTRPYADIVATSSRSRVVDVQVACVKLQFDEPGGMYYGERQAKADCDLCKLPEVSLQCQIDIEALV